MTKYCSVRSYKRSLMSKKRFAMTRLSSRTGWVAFGIFNTLLCSLVVANSDFCGSAFESQPDHTLVGHVMETAIVADQFECQLKCITNNSCKSFNLHPSADSKAKHICELNNKTRHMAPKKFKPKKGSTYYGSVKLSCIDNSRGERKQANDGHCHPGYKGKQCEVKKGSHHSYPGVSCKDLRDSTNTHLDGEYWIDPEAKGNPLKVYCDMTTDGGGWLLVFNVLIGSSAPSQLSVATSYRQISGYHDNKMVIEKSAMNELRKVLPYSQLRFHCVKKQGRTFHVTTTGNSSGNAVVQYFSGQTDVVPDSCGSFVRMADDNSRLAGVCHDWGYQGGVFKVGKWSAGLRGEARLYDHAAFVQDANHWVLLPSEPRFDCDDEYNGVSSGDFWKVFVR